MIRPEAVVFDFDFTLADSSKAIVECMGCALREVGYEIPPSEQIVDTIGLSLPETFRRLTGATDSSMETRFVQRYHRRADQIMDTATSMYECAAPVLELLRSVQMRTGVVSTKLNHRISNILKRNQLDHLFDVIVGADDVTNTKPDPEGLLLALKKLGVSPGAAVYVGDHIVDAEAAGRAGMAFIAVLSGRHSRNHFHLGDAGCLAVMESVGELPRVLDLVAQKR